MPVTIKDIARKANVSITTVSLILNNKDKNISEETREKVKRIVKELNYRPNVLAQSLITNKSMTIGLLVPDITNPFFSETARGIEDILDDNNYNVFLCNTYNDINKEIKYIDAFSKRRTDGIIISSVNAVDKSYYEYLNSLNIPFIILDRHNYDIKYKNCVIIDDYRGGYLAAKHLLELNHRKIGCINESRGLFNINERLRGYKAALKEYGIEFYENITAAGDLTIEGGYKAALKLFESSGVTAVFACNDLMAIGVYDAAKELHIKIPDDISVVGFDDINFSRHLNPGLTTIKQPIYEIGKAAAADLIYFIKHGKINEDIKILEVSLQIRESTKRLNE